MKKVFFILTLMLITLTANGATEINGIYYELDSSNQTAEVTTPYNGYYSGDISIPSSVSYNGDYYNVTSIGRAFSGSSVTSVSIPNSVTLIAMSAFSWCYHLTSITIGNNVTSIGAYAFDNCSSLTSIIIPNSVTKIGSYAFTGCTSLSSVNIPNSVTSIGNHAFDYCVSLPIENNVRYADTYLVGAVYKSLTSCHIKEGTRFIGDNAFVACNCLTSIYIPNSVTSIGENTFSGCI